MGLDLSFLLGAADGAGGVQMPNMQRDQAAALTLAQLSRQNRLGADAEQETLRARQEQDAYRAALPALLKAGFSREAIQAAVEADPRIGGTVLKEADARRKTALDEEKTVAEIGDKRTGATSKFFSDIAGVAEAEMQQPQPSLSRLKSVADTYRMPLPRFTGDQANPDDVKQYLASVRGAGYAVKDQVAGQQADRKFTADEQQRLWKNQFDTSTQQETGRHNRATEGLTARGQNMTDARAREFNATAREQVGATRDAASGARVDAQAQQYAKMIDSTGLPNLITSASALDASIAKYAKSGDMPGVGIYDSNIPAILQGPEGRKIRSQIQAVTNDLLKLYSGGAVTLNEAERRTVEMMASGQFDENDLRTAWPLVKGRIDAASQNVRAGFAPEVVNTYEQRGGLKLKPVGSDAPNPSPSAAPAKPKSGEKRDGYTFMGGDPAVKGNWRKD